MFTHLRWTFLLLALCLLFVRMSPAFGAVERVLHPQDRIVFIGDSITGNGGNEKDGYVHQIAWALTQAHPDWSPTLVALGGSGQGIGSWMNVERGSREKDSFLDVKGVNVKEELGKPADVMVIMLGMNDILSPNISTDSASLDAWVERYRTLLQTLRTRIQPRVVALTTVTMNTEDPDSPKNRMRRALNVRIADLAAQEGCLLLPAGQEMEATLATGRTFAPGYHVTRDLVHPTLAGHAAIAIGMLKGFGEPDAAQALTERYLLPGYRQAAGTLPALSYSIEPVAGSLDSDTQTFQIHYWYTAEQTATAPRVCLDAPVGWHVSPASINAATGVFTVTGKPDLFTTNLSLFAEVGKPVTVPIPAPWLLGTGFTSKAAWPSGVFNAEKAACPLDAPLLRGECFGLPLIAPDGAALRWQRYFPSVNYTGGANQASIDFVSASFAQNFEAGYAARWIYSRQARPVRCALSTQVFAGNMGLTAWLAGTQIYAGQLTGQPGKRVTVDAQLAPGWNLLLLRSNHQTWQWQCAASLSGIGEDTLDDVRVSTTPK